MKQQKQKEIPLSTNLFIFFYIKCIQFQKLNDKMNIITAISRLESSIYIKTRNALKKTPICCQGQQMNQAEWRLGNFKISPNPTTQPYQCTASSNASNQTISRNTDRIVTGSTTLYVRTHVYTLDFSTQNY